jgi:hypothetical protein
VFDELADVLLQLRRSSITELSVSIGKGPGRTKKSIDRLTRLCYKLQLAGCRLPSA